MKILLTGAAGFIGMHTALKLLERGDEVVGLDNLNDYYDPALKQARLKQSQPWPKFKFIKADVADTAAVMDIFVSEKPQRVIHLAAQAGVRYSLTNPQAYIQSNLVGFGNILEACRHNHVEHLVYASSSSVYGTRPEIIRLSRVLAALDVHCDHVLVHTGQNYDYELNQVFFDDLGVRKPDYFLNSAEGSTGAANTIGNLITAVDGVLAKEQPEAMLVLGDTNSCLSVIPAKRRKVPIFHMEAGMEEAAVMMVGLEVDRVRQGLAIVATQARGEQRDLRLVADYSMPNVSAKVVRIIHSYTDYVNRVVWKKY